MYRLDWLENVKLRMTARPALTHVAVVSPVVWSLGFTSLLTDVSTEMVSSALPAYLVLHLHLSPLQYGIIDGLYNGFAIALLSIVAGVIADRLGRHKEVAAVGYGLSGLCKVLLMVAGGTWGWIAAVIGLDRAGKGLRAAPRDALISFNTPPPMLATAFAVHRSLDAGGALLGPIVAFSLLAFLPGGYDALWMTSFVFAVLGLGVLWLFVPPSRAHARPASAPVPSPAAAAKLLAVPKVGALAACALILSVATVSDGFIYLLLQKRTDVSASFLPLFFVATAGFYMLFSIPVGALADRWGRTRTLLGGYLVLFLVYGALLGLPSVGMPSALLCLAMMGLYYAATEGVLMAMASAVVPASLRTSGLAIIGTAIGVGKMLSSVLFGWIWGDFGAVAAFITFMIALAVALSLTALWLHAQSREPANA